ncbi:predicted protein [Fibroporia radiculosa]|uniref:Uncharacterized protein n=1 Tax=Fibroporia radiculosa TaxID=599839 RepID=J7SCV1_9APHY|nr:predicted protein [Fibroporia radiculosa]
MSALRVTVPFVP